MTRYSACEDGGLVARIGNMHAKHFFDNQRRVEKYKRAILRSSQTRRARHRLSKAYRVFDVWMDSP
jgi:hypothetical protein